MSRSILRYYHGTVIEAPVSESRSEYGNSNHYTLSFGSVSISVVAVFLQVGGGIILYPVHEPGSSSET
jgi:hypothetical protein